MFSVQQNNFIFCSNVNANKIILRECWVMYSIHENKPYNRFLPVIFIVCTTMCYSSAHKVYPSDVHNSFTETHTIDVRPMTAVNATNTSFCAFARTYYAMIANSPTSSQTMTLILKVQCHRRCAQQSAVYSLPRRERCL